jgi:NAD(P)-dependent dehydrogenase (short-subunit alcohol dehydrogenase family)
VAAAALAHGASVVISSSSQERVDAAVERLKQGIPGASNVSVKGQAFDIKDSTTLKTFLSQEGPFDHLVSNFLLSSDRSYSARFQVVTAGGLPGNLNFPHGEIDESAKRHFE